MKPRLEDTKDTFSKRFMEDETMAELYPDRNDRLFAASKAYDQSQAPQNQTVVVKVENTLNEETKAALLRISDKVDNFKVPEDGKDGHVPEKGVDYFTNDEIKEIKRQILADIPIPEPITIKEVIEQHITKEITPAERESIINDALSRIDFTMPEVSAVYIKGKLETLKGNKRLSASAIKDLPTATSEVMPGGGGGGAIRTVLDTSSVDLTVTTTGILSAVVLPAGVDHNSLANLTVGDVHTQYALLAGRAGGQTLYGGTAASESLVLLSTSHATKGIIQIGANNQVYISSLGMVGHNITTGMAQTGSKGLASFTGTGTVSTTAGSPTLTGVGTKFTTELGMGDRVTVGSETRYIKSITSDTVATILVNSTGFTNNNSSVSFTVLKAAYRYDDNSGVPHVLLDDQGRLIISKGTLATFPDADTGSPSFSVVIASNASDQLVVQHTGAGAPRITFVSSIGVASGASVLLSTRDNSLYSGNTMFQIYTGNQTTNAQFTVREGSSTSGTNPMVGVGVVTKLATFTVQSGADQTGIGTVTNSGSGTTVTGSSTFFTLQCAVGDRVTINGETVFITAIASNTSMTTETITGANSGVAFTIKKAILTALDSGGTIRMVLSDTGQLYLGRANGDSLLDINGSVRIRDNDIKLGTTTGTKIGTGTTQKLAFWNTTPVVQPASANQAAVATTPAALVSYGYTQAQADGIVTLLNQIRSDLVSIGLLKGSA